MPSVKLEPIIVLQVQTVQLGQQPSFTGMEYGTPHTRAGHMAKCLVKGCLDGMI